jgi:preprotein translocase subunit SecA
MYEQAGGMTGTADTEAAEFNKIYNLDVVVFPPTKMIRRTIRMLFIRPGGKNMRPCSMKSTRFNKIGQPVLVGTVSIDVSEHVSQKLKKRGIPHTVLNAKNHEAEAEIVANAGQKGAVTISTNMAGRGTDIVLGKGWWSSADCICSAPSAMKAGASTTSCGDGPAGRATRVLPGFYLSLEDDLLRIFGGERISSIMSRLGMEEGEPIEHRMISKAIENAQNKVEAHNFRSASSLLILTMS